MKNTNVRAMFYFFLFFCVIGLVGLGAGVRNYMQEEAFFATAEHDTATITEYVPDPNYKSADFCPHYEFTTKSGTTVDYVGDKCVSVPDSSQIGQHEEVYIDPQVPQIVESKGLTGSEGSGLLLGIAGFVFFPFVGLVSLLATFFSERKKAAKTTNWKPAVGSSDDAELAQLEQEEAKLRQKLKKRQ